MPGAFRASPRWGMQLPSGQQGTSIPTFPTNHGRGWPVGHFGKPGHFPHTLTGGHPHGGTNSFPCWRGTPPHRHSPQITGDGWPFPNTWSHSPHPLTGGRPHGGTDGFLCVPPAARAPALTKNTGGCKKARTHHRARAGTPAVPREAFMPPVAIPAGRSGRFPWLRICPAGPACCPAGRPPWRRPGSRRRRRPPRPLRAAPSLRTRQACPRRCPRCSRCSRPPSPAARRCRPGRSRWSRNSRK